MSIVEAQTCRRLETLGRVHANPGLTGENQINCFRGRQGERKVDALVSGRKGLDEVAK